MTAPIPCDHRFLNAIFKPSKQPPTPLPCPSFAISSSGVRLSFPASPIPQFHPQEPPSFMAVLPFCSSVVQWQSGPRRGIDGEAGWNRTARVGALPGERTAEWTTKLVGRASGWSVSRVPANHDDGDEGVPQLLEFVNSTSALSSHGQAPQTGWGTVHEESPPLK